MWGIISKSRIVTLRPLRSAPTNQIKGAGKDYVQFRTLRARSSANPLAPFSPCRMFQVEARTDQLSNPLSIFTEVAREVHHGSEVSPQKP